MDTVYEQRPSAVAGSFVWRSVSDGSPTRILPDGCLDLLWMDGALAVSGPDTVAELHCSAAGTQVAGIRFAPGLGPTVLGIPAAELTDQRIPLDAIWSGPEVRRLTQRLAEAPSPGDLLERVGARCLTATAPDPLVGHLAAELGRGRPVDALAREVGLSPRQLHRRSLHAFGYGPKLLTRILRVQHALALARAGTTFATVAAEAGYSDQSHLARDVRALAGAPLGQLVGAPSAAPVSSGANRSTPLPSGSSTAA